MRKEKQMKSGEKIKQFLLTTGYSIAEIAGRGGISKPNSIYNAFKKDIRISTLIRLSRGINGTLILKSEDGRECILSGEDIEVEKY